jgi:acetolactate synthase I/II/III large subunit
VIEMHQRRKFGRLCGTRFENPDLVGLAESFGLAGLRVESADQVTPVLRKALELDIPSVVEIPIDYRENVRFSQRLADLSKVEEGVV